MTTTDFSKYSRIPSLPTVAVEAVKLFHDSNSSNETLVSIVRKDPAIVCRLLKAANSARYGNRGEVTDLLRAVNMLGRAATASLVLSFSLARQSMEDSDHLNHFRGFWLRSFVQATAAEVLASQFGSPAFRGECYTTSLLSGMGKLALLRAEPEQYLQILRKAAEENAPLARIEQQTLGFTHCQLSSALLQQMSFPERFHRAILAISDTSVVESCDASDSQPLAKVTRIADAVANLICGDAAAVAIVSLRRAMEDINLPTELSVEELIDQVKDRLEASAELFDIDPPKMPSAGEVLQEALDQLSRYAAMADDVTQNAEVPAELLEENGRLKRRVADLLHASRIDPLTGVCNRAYFLQQLHEHIALHRVRGQSIGFAVVDIDHFKKINDTYGHQAGDDALKVVAATLKNTMRETDVVGRYGGEEFVVLLEDASPEGLAIAGERIRSRIEAAAVSFEGQAIRVTASVGLTEGCVQGSEVEFGLRLFAVADAAMYRAKNSGRNCVVLDSIRISDTAPNLQNLSQERGVPVTA
ncbi:MAG TPA: GGDEF domain-containing protein [Planctomycetaceae bacterium]|nr:GGDEF domain-containing protein [Planctomycetaceae bacterium]HQZ66603.1 GGDEF domain-containing protein [Planctomycetaceae bacterium]